MTQSEPVKLMSRREQNRADKHQRALDAALSEFVSNGYASTTMDAIATRAGLTKPTLYQYFPSKEDLFREMMCAPRKQMIMAFEHSADVCHVSQLWDFSWVYAKTVMHPSFLALARLVIGDAQRFPDLGRAYQESGPDLVLRGLTEFMAVQGRLGSLEIEDAELAAEDFWGLILSAPRNKALHIPDAYSNIQEMNRYVHNGMKVFLKAYSTNPTADLLTLKKLIDNQAPEKA